MEEELQTSETSSLDQAPTTYTSDTPASPESPPKSDSNKLMLLIVGAVFSVLVIVGIAGFLLIQKPEAKKPEKAATPITINTQSLDNGTLNKISAKSGSTETKQQLTIAPDTLFKNSVTVQGVAKTDKSLDVGGNLTINGTTSMQGAVGINDNLVVRGALSVGGALSAASISVGSLTISTINISGGVNFGGHIVPGGATPITKASNAAGGGTVAISGNDTAGTITITTGSTPTAGEMAIISFRAAFSGTPKVQLTPINTAASAINYYATRSTTFFTVDSSSPLASGTIYTFDYLVTQ